MSTRKKSRKVGKIGVTKKEVPLRPKKSKVKKPSKGNKAGSRQALSSENQGNYTKVARKDPRLGSKQKVDLLKYSKASAPISRFSTPEEELNAIENDPRLDTLLAKQEMSSLTKKERTYVETTLARHKELCELLGIELDDEENETDPYAALNAIKIEDFNDDK